MQKDQFYGHEQFVCVWRTAQDTFTTEIHGVDFFTNENGYSSADIEEIADLLISESADLSAPTQAHYVMRIA